MTQESLIPFMAVFAGGGLAFFAIWYFVTSVASRRREHLRHRMGGDDYEEPLLLESAVVARRGKDIGSKIDSGFDQLVANSGFELDSNLAMSIILFCGVILGAVTFVWRYEEESWLSIPAFFLGCSVPLVILLWRQQAWRRLLQKQLPDGLYLLARSVRAGRSIDQSFQLVGDQGLQPLSKEFQRMSRQMELGLSLPQVLQITSRRLKLVDFNVFAGVLSLHRTTGGNLPTILDRIATTTRDRNQFEGQYRAATVLGRYSAAFIAFLACVIMGYQFFFQRQWAMRFFETSTGLTLFISAMVLELMGGILLYWLMRHDY